MLSAMAGYLATVYLHILAAVIWVGGMLFLSLVVVPVALRLSPERRGALLSDMGSRFRWVGWACIVVLAVTGVLLLERRGTGLGEVFAGAFIGGPRGVVLLTKLSAFGAMVALSLLHDFVLGPRLTIALQTAPTRAKGLRRGTSWLARANLALGLAVLVLAVLLVRT